MYQLGKCGVALITKEQDECQTGGVGQQRQRITATSSTPASPVSPDKIGDQIGQRQQDEEGGEAAARLRDDDGIDGIGIEIRLDEELTLRWMGTPRMPQRWRRRRCWSTWRGKAT